MSEPTPGPGSLVVLVYEYVTGGGLAPGSWTADLAAKGHAMRRALVHDLAAVPGVSVRMMLDAQYADEPGPWDSIRVASGSGDADVLMREARAADHVVLIAPETQGLLAERAEWVQASGASKLLGPGPVAIRLAGHKGRLADQLAGAGVNVPASRILSSKTDLPDFTAFPYPAVVKPVDGAGAHATFFVDDPDRPPVGALDELPVLLQAYVPGTPMSASFLVDNHGQAHLVAVGRQRISIENGRFRYRGGVVPAGHVEMATEARRAVEAVPGLRGWIGVDFIWNEASGQAVVIEINPRVTMSFVGLSRRLPGGTISRAWLAACAPGTVEAAASSPPLSEQVGQAGRPVCFDLRGAVRIEDEGT